MDACNSLCHPIPAAAISGTPRLFPSQKGYKCLADIHAFDERNHGGVAAFKSTPNCVKAFKPNGLFLNRQHVELDRKWAVPPLALNLREGQVAFLRKPVHRDELLRVIWMALERIS